MIEGGSSKLSSLFFTSASYCGGRAKKGSAGLCFFWKTGQFKLQRDVCGKVARFARTAARFVSRHLSKLTWPLLVWMLVNPNQSCRDVVLPGRSGRLPVLEFEKHPLQQL